MESNDEYLLHQVKFVDGKFLCPKCPSKFSHRNSLNRHFRYECGKEPSFKCPYCNYAGKRAANIYRHVRAINPKYPVLIYKKT